MLATQQNQAKITIPTYSAITGAAPGGAPGKLITLRAAGGQPGMEQLQQPIELIVADEALLTRFNQTTRWEVKVLPGSPLAGTVPTGALLVPVRCTTAAPGQGGAQAVTFAPKGYGQAAGSLNLHQPFGLMIGGEGGGGFTPGQEYTLAVTAAG